jgi:hypothetical protein
MALAAANYCQDSAIDQPTWVDASPSYSSAVVQTLNKGAGVGFGPPPNGSNGCEYYLNSVENRWYMPVRTTNGSNGGTGYIWVQRLYYGSQHECYTLLYGIKTIGSAYCQLVDVGGW